MNCFFYDEDMDMGARIPFCSLAGLYERFKCEGCEYCVSREKVKELVEKHIKERENRTSEKEPTYEEVLRYCEKRGLALVDAYFLTKLFKCRNKE